MILMVDVDRQPAENVIDRFRPVGYLNPGFEHMNDGDFKHRENPQRAEYTARINRVIDYIQTHLEEELSLGSLSRIAHFSPYHFHRIFRAMVGETLSRFIQRIRIEKAAGELVHDHNKTITEIALENGFSSSSAFARAFRESFGMSASTWRSGGFRLQRKNGTSHSNSDQTDSNTGKDFEIVSFYSGGGSSNQTWRITMKDHDPIPVEVRNMPEMPVAYIRHIGPYKADAALFESLFNALWKWAGPRGLLRFPETKCLSVYHDNPDITEEDKLRTDVCITVPQDTPVDGKIGKMTIPAGTYAVGHFEIDADGYQAAWNAVYGGWLPESGYQPADGPCFEMYLNNPKEHPQHKHIVDICIPVKPL